MCNYNKIKNINFFAINSFFSETICSDILSKIKLISMNPHPFPYLKKKNPMGLEFIYLKKKVISFPCGY